MFWSHIACAPKRAAFGHAGAKSKSKSRIVQEYRFSFWTYIINIHQNRRRRARWFWKIRQHTLQTSGIHGSHKPDFEQTGCMIWKCMRATVVPLRDMLHEWRAHGVECTQRAGSKSWSERWLEQRWRLANKSWPTFRATLG